MFTATILRGNYIYFFVVTAFLDISFKQILRKGNSQTELVSLLQRFN